MTPTLLFWLAVLALVAATLAALVWPLVRRGARGAGPAEMTAAQSVYRDQKRQLDADLAAGAITAAEHDLGQEEMIGRLGAEIAAQPVADTVTTPSKSRWAVPVLVVAIPVASVVAYQFLGTPAALAPRTAENAGSRLSDDDVQALVERLATRMKANPSDPKGWLLLARSYGAMGRYPDAAAAFGEAAQRMPADAQVYADWADVVAMAQGKKLAGQPEELLKRALDADPKNRKALALTATALLERGDVDAALARWRELRQLIEPGSDEARMVDGVIAEVETNRRGMAGNAAVAQAGASAPTGQPIAADAGTVSGRVELDPKLAANAAPNDTVFIVARAAEGSRIPLAVKRMHAHDLPADFRLDDSMGMLPEAKLSATPKIVVEARVSKSGNAMTHSGDLRGTSAPVAPGARDIRIVVGEIVP
jgi:cytochrome c-type biogenesis protein CcmH